MKIFLIVLLILFLLGQVRVGVRLELKENIFSLWARLGAIKLQILPAKPKKEKPEKPPKEKKPAKEKAKKEPPAKVKKKAAAPEKTADEKAAGEEKEEKSSLSDKVDMGLDYARSFLPIVLDLGKHFFRKLQIDTLRMILTVGDSDPADAAMLYGRANAALGALWYPLTNTFHVKDGSARVALDFDDPKTDLYIQAALSLKIGQILWIGLYFGLRALGAFLSVHSRQKKKAETRKAA